MNRISLFAILALAACGCGSSGHIDPPVANTLMSEEPGQVATSSNPEDVQRSDRVVGSLPIVDPQDEWAPGDIVAVDLSGLEDSARSPEYLLHPLDARGELGQPIYREFYGTEERPPNWSPIDPNDFPLDMNESAIDGPGPDLLIIPPTIDNGSYVLCTRTNGPVCTDALTVTGEN